MITSDHLSVYLPAQTWPSVCIALLFCCVWDISGHHTLYLLLTIASCCMWLELYEIKDALFTYSNAVSCSFAWETKLWAEHAHRFVSVCHLYHTGVLNGHRLQEEVCGLAKSILEVLQSCICVGILKHNKCKTIRKWHFIFLLHCFVSLLSYSLSLFTWLLAWPPPPLHYLLNRELESEPTFYKGQEWKVL